MNHYQLVRLAAHKLLSQHNLWLPSNIALPITESYVDRRESQELKLVEYGLSLLQTLCGNLNISISGVEADDTYLQGSLAKFVPDAPHERNSGGEIFYSRALSSAQKVFAIAHELAHSQLHWGQVTHCHNRDFSQDGDSTAGGDAPTVIGEVEVYNPRNLREQEANSFALELLMPSSEFRRAYLALTRSRTAVVGNSDPVYTNDLEPLVERFGIDTYYLLMQLGNVFLATPLPDANPAMPNNTKNDVEQKTIKLDIDQAAAVHVAVPALVLAGPGSGKTRTLVERVRYLVQQKNVNPAQLLVLTFSNKAADELRERLAAASIEAETMQIATFHAYGVDFLRRYAERLEWLPRDFRVLDPAHAYMVMEDLLVRFPQGYYVNPYNPYGHLSDLWQDISRTKEFLHTPEEYTKAVERMRTATLGDDSTLRYSLEAVSRAQERAQIFAIYEQYKQANGLVDFGDLVMLPVHLLQLDTEVRQAERARFQQVLVDEFQDINYANGQLLQVLCSPKWNGNGNIWAVGDLNQSIYRFRGAFPSQAGAEAFQRDYGGPELEVGIKELSFNYRSLPPIVELANHLRGQMPPAGTTLPLQAVRMAREDVADSSDLGLYYTIFNNTSTEIATIIQNIASHRTAGYAYSDHAILCLRHSQADQMAQALTVAGIGVSRFGSFFNRPPIQSVLALVTLLNKDEPLALLRLGQQQLAVTTLLKLAAQFKLTLRQALSDGRVLANLDAQSQTVAMSLAHTLDKLNSKRSLWKLIAEYVFNYSSLIAELTEQQMHGDEQAVQNLRALGQLLRVAVNFDRESEARVYAAEEKRLGLGRGLTVEEQERARLAKLRPSSQRQEFLRYINALVQSDTRVELNEDKAAGDRAANANTGRVHILTAHSSKGLEYPFVYLPGLHQPKQPPIDVTLPPPPDFHYTEGEGRAEDERSLFYVAATRARDCLYLSWAEREREELASDNNSSEDNMLEDQDEANNTNFGSINRGSPVRRPHAILQAALAHRQIFPARWHKLEPVADAAVKQVITVSTSHFVSQARSEMPAASDTIEIVYPALKRYEDCPSRYYYQYVAPSTNHTYSAQSHLYTGIQAAQNFMYSGLINVGSLPNLETLLQEYDAGWNKHRPKSNPPATVGIPTASQIPPTSSSSSTHTTASDYFHRQGEHTITQLWQQQKTNLSGDSRAEPEVIKVEFDVLKIVQLKQHRVQVRLDRVETLTDGSKRLIHSRLKVLPADEKKLDTDKVYRLLALYALAFPNQPTIRPNQVILEAVGLDGAFQMVAAKAYKKAEAYKNWLNHKAKTPGLIGALDKLTEGIRQGRFDPKPSDECKRCPFYTLVCPVKPI